MQRAANAWDRFYRFQPAPWRGEHAVADLLPWLPGPGAGRILELGCGNGKMVRPLARAGLDVVALDISWHVLGTVAGVAPAVPRVLADASWLPFADGAFAAVLDIHCTGHLLAPGRVRAAADIARILTPGGVLVTERLAPDDLRTTTGAWVEGEPGTRVVEDGRTTRFSTEAELAAEFGAAGLRLEASGTVRREIRHRGEPVLRSATRVRMRKPT